MIKHDFCAVAVSLPDPYGLLNLACIHQFLAKLRGSISRFTAARLGINKAPSLQAARCFFTRDQSKLKHLQKVIHSPLPFLSVKVTSNINETTNEPQSQQHGNGSKNYLKNKPLLDFVGKKGQNKDQMLHDWALFMKSVLCHGLGRGLQEAKSLEAPDPLPVDRSWQGMEVLGL